MDAKSFRRLCAALGGLTGPQLRELRAALRALDARMQAIGAIEKRREGGVACPYCEHDKAARWGSTRTGVQRMRCASCRRTFSSSTGTAVARIHSPARFHFQSIALDMPKGSDLTASSEYLAKLAGSKESGFKSWLPKNIALPEAGSHIPRAVAKAVYAAVYYDGGHPLANALTAFAAHVKETDLPASSGSTPSCSRGWRAAFLPQARTRASASLTTSSSTI